jgi:polysaccharide pyruvyl transferase WcaK-like protein
VRHVLGAENVEFSVMTQNFDRTKGYFEGSRQVHLPDVYPPFLFREVHANHGVVACEGSMFKSKFANALTTMMIGSLGIASAENKLSVAYGGDAGHMDDLIKQMCARYTRESLVITRSLESQQLLSGLGVPNELGADTAWTFEPHPPEYARQALREAGWDEKTPILALCPIHPFVWPVRASIGKYLARMTTGAYKDSQYRTVYFFESGAEVDRKFAHYVAGYAKAAKAFLQKHRVFPILVAMERLDAVACREIAKEIPGTPVLTSDDYDMFQLVSILRACTYLVSSRYHGIVTCMPAQVVSAGVTMDERIRNLMRERGHQHLVLTVDDPDLEPKLLQVMESLVTQAEAIRENIGKTVVSNLKAMARMAIFMEDEVRRTYPEFPLRCGVMSWEDNLPPLNENLRKLVETYDRTPAALAAGR